MYATHTQHTQHNMKQALVQETGGGGGLPGCQNNLATAQNSTQPTHMYRHVSTCIDVPRSRVIRHTCVSTGNSARPRQNIRTQATVFGPTPLNRKSSFLAAASSSPRTYLRGKDGDVNG
jgi:hypothetical protein